MDEKTVHRQYGELLRTDLSSFIAKTFSSADPGASYAHNWHIDLIAEYLEAAGRGEIRRLIINMPPRYLKSICVSVAWPAWLLGHNPSERILTASYSASLALKHSVDCRQVMHSSWFRGTFPAVEFTRDQNEKHKFMTTARGYRIATSVGGTVTGEGGNYLILDDPLSASQAQAKPYRDAVNRWYEQAFASRLDDKKKGVVVLVMQRLQAEDLSGYLLARGGWEHVCLPAVATERTVHDFGKVTRIREPGELLHPAREENAEIERARRELGSYNFAAQYQQNPVPAEGAMVKAAWLARYECEPAQYTRMIQSWDTAIKAGAKHDASVCLTFGEAEGVSYLLDAMELRLEYPLLKRVLVEHASHWKPHAMLIEDKASGQQLLQDLRKDTQLPLIACMPSGDKVTRLAGVSAIIEAGGVKFPVRAHWLAALEMQLLQFPDAPHDDYVDALCQYLQWRRGQALVQPVIRRI